MDILILVMIFTFDIATCYKIISRRGIITDFTIDYESKCQSSTDRFKFINDISIVECMQECGLRNHCKGLNFWKNTGGCELFYDGVEGNMNNGNCLHIFARDIQTEKLPCGDCTFGKVCDVKSESCIYKECRKEHLPENSTHYGNMFSIGSTVLYKCNEGFLTTENWTAGKAVCMENGQWNASGCILSCGEPAIKHARAVLDKPNSAFYMDTATVTCDAWYQTRKNTIKCQSSGEWEKTICEDCYLTTPWTYTGKRNTTATGMPCYRWDSPEAMAYNYTDTQYFPESTLSEAENFCRNPTRGLWEPWCITTNKTASDYWEYCDITECSHY